MERKTKEENITLYTWNLYSHCRYFWKWINTKTPFCQHDDRSCFIHSLKAFAKNAAVGYCFKLGISILSALIRKQKGIKDVLRGLIEKETFNFGLFLGMVCLLSKFSLCSLRRIREKDDKYNAIIAGALSSLAVFIHRSNSIRKILAMYLFARSIDSLVKTLDSNGIIKEQRHWSLLLYVAVVNWLNFHIVFSPDLVGKSNTSWFDRISCSQHNDELLFKYVLLERGRRR